MAPQVGFRPYARCAIVFDSWFDCCFVIALYLVQKLFVNISFRRSIGQCIVSRVIVEEFY